MMMPSCPDGSLLTLNSDSGIDLGADDAVEKKTTAQMLSQDLCTCVVYSVVSTSSE